MLTAEPIRVQFICDNCECYAVCMLRKTGSYDANWAGVTTLCVDCTRKLALRLLDLADVAT